MSTYAAGAIASACPRSSERNCPNGQECGFSVPRREYRRELPLGWRVGALTVDRWTREDEFDSTASDRTMESPTDARGTEAATSGSRTARAVLDRIVDNEHAVLLVGPGEVEMIVPRGSLPAGAVEGTWLYVHLDGNRLVSAEVDKRATDATTERVVSKMDLLRRRGSRLAGAEDTE